MTTRSAVSIDARLLAAGGQQAPGHLLGVAPVHLAAERPDVEARQRPGLGQVLRRGASSVGPRATRGARRRGGATSRTSSIGRRAGSGRASVTAAPWYAEARPRPVSSAHGTAHQPRDLDRPPHADGPRDRPRASTTSSSSRSSSSACRRSSATAPGTIGLGLAMGMRILLLLTISWIAGLTAPVFTHRRQRVLVARPDPHRRRPVPALEGDDRDRRIARGRASPPRRAGRPDGRRSAACSSRSSCSTSSSRSTRS